MMHFFPFFVYLTFCSTSNAASWLNATADICGVNEEFHQCGSACPMNCAFPEEALVCTQKCVAGCFCIAGYRRNHNHTCIEEHLCPEATPNDCGQNEEFLECGSQCLPTCEKPAPPENCTLPCTKGCFCKDGYVRDTNSGQCVTLQSCSEFCLIEYEEYSPCSAQCQPSCVQLQPICNQSCSRGCICSEGLVRDKDWKCVPREQCPTNGTFDGDVLAPLWKILERLIFSAVNKD